MKPRFPKQIQRIVDEEIRRTTLVTRQQTLDIVCKVLYDEFGFAETRQDKFRKEYLKEENEVFRLTARDSHESGKRIDVAKTYLDRTLKKACGKNFKSWEERYDFHD